MQRLTEQLIRERTYFKNVSERTVGWYRQSFGAFGEAMESKSAVGERIVELRLRSISPTTVNTYLRAVNAYFRWCYTEGHTPERIRVPKLKEEQKVLATLSPEHVKRVIGSRPKGPHQKPIHTLACLLLDTGLRIDEVLSLTRNDVDFENLLLRVHGKGGTQRLVPFSTEMRTLLWRWLRDASAELVFASRTGTKVLQRNIPRYFKIFGSDLQITGVRFSFHTMRHTFVVNYRNGADVFRPQRILGHSTLEMTRRYVNLQTGDLSAAHERLSLLSRRIL